MIKTAAHPQNARQRQGAAGWPRPLALSGRRASGFTLIELLTVIAIIGVLATLLLSAATSAKKKSRQSYCTANLRQISLATTMYLDDHDKRPAEIQSLVTATFLPNPRSLLCPEDKTKNWGGLVQVPQFGASLTIDLSAPSRSVENSEPQLPYSYLHPFWWSDAGWKRLLEEGFLAGLATCQLHGIGKPDEAMPSVRDYQGLILRAQRDGAVVRRHVFWTKATADPAAGDASAIVLTPSSFSSGAPTEDYPWPLFIDVAGGVAEAIP